MDSKKIIEMKYRKWVKWICSIYTEVDGLIFYQMVFKETNKVILSNEHLEKDNNFYALFNAGYVYVIVSIIRRLVKTNNKGSLKALLLDISQNLNVLKQYNKDITLKRVLSDIKELEKHTKSIEDFADNHIAHKHITKTGSISFKNIEKAISLIHNLYDYYGKYIGANHLEIEYYYDKKWLSIFTKPWILG